MRQLCATIDGEAVCMPIDLTVLEDAGRLPLVAAAGGATDVRRSASVPLVRTRVAQGAVPDAWPRDERFAGELVKGQGRIPCELLVHARDGDDGGAVDVILIGEEVYTAVTGRAP